ncbi:MAG: translesion error-prone DNA polymerase V autoproteolytic subunit [Spirochaetia bacterium]|nr:translesion error-prone DNA polymerase V autoproteolytic subunit [Spirochaetia bacterium]
MIQCSSNNMLAIKLNTCPILEIYSALTEASLKLPILPFRISAGFPSPALDFVDMGIDLNQHLIKHPSATFYGRVKGESMKNAGINDGDLLVIDKSIEPVDGKIAVCYIDGEFTLKQIRLENGRCRLMPANKLYEPIEITEHHDLQIWGIVTHVIKDF